MQGIISAFINGALSAYMVEVKSNIISGSLAHKNLKIAELEIFPDALLQHGLPILIKKGLIKNVEIRAPTKITTEPITITIESVTIFANIYTRHPTPSEIINMKIRLLKSYKYFRKRYKPILGFLQKASFLSFFRSVMSNIIIEINNLHVRIEHSSKSNLDSVSQNISPNLSTEPSINTKYSNIDDDPQDNDYDDKNTKQKECHHFKKFQSNDYYSDDSNESSSDDDISPSQRFEMYEKFNQETDPSSEKVTAIGIVMKKLVFQNPENYKVISNEKIIKEVTFSDLAVYMDSEQVSINSVSKEQFLSKMNSLFDSENHKWILKKFSFSSIIKYEKINPILLIEPIMKTILVNVREEYIPLFLEFLKAYETFYKVISVANIPKPSTKYPQNFWLYVHNCALLKISNPSYDFNQGIILLLKRLKYIKNYKKKNAKSVSIIKEMEETLEYSNIIAFRASYRLIHKKKKAKGKSKITSRTTDKIINESKIDPVYLVTAMIDMISINMKSELITVVLRKNPGKKHVIIDLKKLNLRFDKDLKSYRIHAKISSIQICYKKNKERSIVFSSVDNTSSEMKIDMVVPFRSYSIWKASFDVSKNNYTLNMKWILQIIADLSHLKFPESTMNSENIIKFLKRRKFQLNVQIHSSEIKIVGSKSTCAIEYAFDKLSFATDTKILEGNLCLNNSWVSFITTHAFKVSSEFSVIGSMKGKKLNIMIPLFSCTIPFQYIVVIQDFVDLFLKYQNLIKVDSFPKIEVNFKLDMKGLDINLNFPEHKKQKKLQIRKIKLIYTSSVITFKLSTIKMKKLLSLRNLKIKYDKESLYFKLQYILVKVIDLIQLIPTNVIQKIQRQKTAPVINKANIELSKNDLYSENEASVEVYEMKRDKSIEFPKIKISGKVDIVKLDLKLAEDTNFKFRIKDIKADMNTNKITSCALLEKIKIDHQIIAKQIQCQLEMTLEQIIGIMIKIDNCDLIIDKNLIYLLLNIKYNSPNVVFPHDFGMKISFILNQMTISNDFQMKKLIEDILILNSKVSGTLGIYSVKSSFVEFKTKEFIKFDANIINKSIDLSINLDKIKIEVITLIDLISKLPLDFPEAQPLKLNIKVKINPIQINLCFLEDSLSIILNTPLYLNMNSLKGILPYISLKMGKCVVNLNNSEIVEIKSFNFVLDKIIEIEIPSVSVMVSMIQIYSLIKIVSYILQNRFINLVAQKRIQIKNSTVEKINCKVPIIQLLMQQTKSRRNVSLYFENTEFNLINSIKKAKILGQTRGKFTASDGFLSFDITQYFKITANGEFSENKNFCSVHVEDPILFEITTFTINQILKNLTATEDEAEKQYSISNETGTKISILINNTEYKLQSQEFLPNITNFAESDIKVKIGEISNPFQLYSTYSKISTPLYFDKNFILVWMDTKRLQLRLLSPISFKNKSSLDLEVQVYDKSFLLKNNSTYSLEYTIKKIDSIVVKYNKCIQTVNLADSSVIKLDNNFIVVSKKRKFETLQTTISFYVHYYFRNEMASNIMISIKGEKNSVHEQILIRPYQIVPIPFFLPSLKILSFDVMETKDFEGIHVDLAIEQIKNERCFISTKDKKGKEFILQFSLNITSMNIISISPFLIYYNSLSIPLIFGLSGKENFIREKNLNLQKDSLSNFFPIQSTSNIWKVDDPIMVSPAIKADESKEIKIFIRSEYSSKWSPDPIRISNFDSSSDLQIPLNNDIVSLAHCYVLCNSNLQPNTFLFFISPKYAIINQTSETFSIDLFNDYPIEIQPNSTISVTFIRKSLQFSVAVVPKSKKKANLIYSRSLDIERINSQYLSVAEVDSPVLFKMSVEKNIHFIIMMLNRSMPHLFINKTDLKIIFFQKDTCDSAHTVMPNDSLPFYLFDENMPSVIYCDIMNGINFELDINKPSFPIEIKYKKQPNDSKLYYYVDLSTNEDSVITLINCIDDQISIPINLNTNSNDSFPLDSDSSKNESSINIPVSDLPRLKNYSFNFDLNISQLSIMIITEKYQEMCNITLKNIIVNTIIHNFETNTQATVGLIEVDDQNKYAVYPSVFQILPKGQIPAVIFKVNSFGSHKYGKIELKLRPINFQIDLSFISDFIGEIFYFEKSKSLVNNAEDEDCIDSNESNDESSNENGSAGHFKFKMDGIPLSEIMHNIMPKRNKYHINKIIIHPFIIQASFHVATTRVYHPLQNKYEINYLVNFIPSFNSIVISIDDTHCFLNLSGTTDEFVFSISHEIKRMILNQLSLKNSIIGTKKMAIKAVKCLFKPGEAKEGILNKTNLCLSFCESTLCYFSSMLNMYTNAPTSIRTDVSSYEALHWGISSLTFSIIEGLRELVAEPRQRGNVNGKKYLCGYVAGTAIGLTKCVANITSGFCIFGASLFSSTRRLFLLKKWNLLIKENGNLCLECIVLKMIICYGIRVLCCLV